MIIIKGMVLAAAAIAFGIVSVADLANGSSPASVFSLTEPAAATDQSVVQNGALRRRAAENLRVLMERQEWKREARAHENQR
jgi:hypothetical protein